MECSGLKHRSCYIWAMRRALAEGCVLILISLNLDTRASSLFASSVPGCTYSHGKLQVMRGGRPSRIIGAAAQVSDRPKSARTRAAPAAARHFRNRAQHRPAVPSTGSGLSCQTRNQTRNPDELCCLQVDSHGFSFRWWLRAAMQPARLYSPALPCENGYAQSGMATLKDVRWGRGDSSNYRAL